jgi:ABC-type nitrate/sulfonate/bicarbonate transport system permease component
VLVSLKRILTGLLLASAAIWPILLNTVASVRQLDPCWLQLSRNLSATRWETLRKVILPRAAPRDVGSWA